MDDKKKQTQIIVSIVIPVFKVSAYIERCIMSVIHQTYNCIECIIVDDASPDDSIAKCEHLIVKYDGSISFKIIHHEKNRGLSAARNTGMDAATGDYCFFLDSDDELLPECIEKLVCPIKIDPTIEMVVGNYVLLKGVSCQSINKIKEERSLTNREAVRDYCFCGNGIYSTAWNKLVKRDYMIRHQLYFQDGLLYEDNSWSFFVLKYLQHLYVIPDVTYVYCRRPDSIVSITKKEVSAHHIGMNYEIIVNNLTEGDKAREAVYYMKGLCYICIRHLEQREFRRIGKKFMKVLWEERCLKHWFVLYIVIILSRFQWGKNLFLWAANKVKDRGR